MNSVVRSEPEVAGLAVEEDEFSSLVNDKRETITHCFNIDCWLFVVIINKKKNPFDYLAMAAHVCLENLLDKLETKEDESYARSIISMIKSLIQDADALLFGINFAFKPWTNSVHTGMYTYRIYRVFCNVWNSLYVSGHPLLSKL